MTSKEENRTDRRVKYSAKRVRELFAVDAKNRATRRGTDVAAELQCSHQWAAQLRDAHGILPCKSPAESLTKRSIRDALGVSRGADGVEWASRTLDEGAATLGVSVSTIQKARRRLGLRFRWTTRMTHTPVSVRRAFGARLVGGGWLASVGVTEAARRLAVSRQTANRLRCRDCIWSAQGTPPNRSPRGGVK